VSPPRPGGGPDAHHHAEATSTTRTTTDQGAESAVDGTAQSAAAGDRWKRGRGIRSFAERTSATRRRWTRRRDAADRRIGTTSISEHGLDAWAATITDLQRHGTPAVVEVVVLRALWRRGGPDRRLAEQVHATAVT